MKLKLCTSINVSRRVAFQTATRLAQLGKRSNPGQTNTQGLKKTEENVLPLL